MDPDILKANEIKIRSNVMLLLKDGYVWKSALAKLEARFPPASLVHMCSILPYILRAILTILQISI